MSPGDHLCGLDELFGIDRRSLAAFRVGLAALVIADILKRSIALRAHYTDAGVMPREVLAAIAPDPLIFRFYHLSGSGSWVVVGFALTIGAAVLLAAGWRSRWAAAACLYLVVSIQARNPMVCHTGDAWLTVLLLWAVFLPLGACYGLDELRSGGQEEPPTRILSLPTGALLLQIGLFYFSAGVLKHHEAVWTSGRAVEVFFGIDTYVSRTGELVRTMEWLPPLLTYATLAIETAAPLLLFLPFFTARVRTGLVPVFIGFHLGIWATIHIGIFEAVSILAVLVFLPSWFWDAVLPCVPGYDRVHGAWQTFWRGIEDRMGGAAEREELSASSPGRTPRWLSFLATVCLAWVVTANAMSWTGEKLRLPSPLGNVGQYLFLTQEWSIFTGIDRYRQGWFAAVGETSSGEVVDVWNRRPLDGLARPAHPAEMFPNHNWRRFWHLISLDAYRPMRGELARYLCAEWNRGEEEPLVSLTLVHAGRFPTVGGGAQYVRLGRFRCDDM